MISFCTYIAGRLGARKTAACAHRLAAAPAPVLALLVVAALLALAGCSLGQAEAPQQDIQSGGGISPERVAEDFFDDLGNALKDPQLANDDKRSQWAERLAGYFAPSERDDQRIALRSSLDSFVAGLGELDPNEDLTLELRMEGIAKVDESGDRATVRPINGSIYILITRTANGGVSTLYEDTVALDKVIGGQDGAVPVVRIGRSWFLTEG
jgi:hypothetical protein